MIPGLQIHLSRLDVISAKPPVALAGMRYPAALAEHKQVLLPPAAAGETAVWGAGQSTEQQQQQQVDFLPDLEAEQQQQDASDACLDGHCCQQQQQDQQQPLANGLQQLSITSQQQQDNQSAAAAGLSSSIGNGDTKPWFRYLVLDCDGILVDTEAASCESLRRAILEVTGVYAGTSWSNSPDVVSSFEEDCFCSCAGGAVLSAC